MHRRHRLRSSADFARVTRSGRRTPGRGFVLHHLEPGGAPVPRVGFAVGRQLGTATVRNRTKRRLREALGAVVEELRPCDLVIAVRPGAVGADTDELTSALRETLAAAGLLSPGPRPDTRGTMGARRAQRAEPDVPEGTSS